MIKQILNMPLPAHLGALAGAWRRYLMPVAAIAASVVVGISLGLVRAIPAENKTGPKDTWTLPQLPVPSPISRAMNLDDAADLFWSDEPRTKRTVQTKVQVVNWRFIGTYAQGGQMYAIIADDKRVQAFKAGDTTPTGVIIKDVQEGNLTFEQDGASKTRRLYNKDTGQ